MLWYEKLHMHEEDIHAILTLLKATAPAVQRGHIYSFRESVAFNNTTGS